MAGQTTGVGAGDDWQEALDGALETAATVDSPEIAFLFVHTAYAPYFAEIATAAGKRLGAQHLIGCSAEGLIATRREIERSPSIVVMSARLPGATLTPWRLDHGRTELPADRQQISAWLVFGDPYTVDGEALLAQFNERYPGVPLIGGMSASNERPPKTAVFLDGEVYRDGAVAIGLGGEAGLQTIVSQGCQPIGQPWIITGVIENLIETIASRPAVDVLMETLHELDEETRRRAQANLLVGLAMDEYRDRHGMGDFLIRNVMGYVKETGALAITAVPHQGQTVQFQFRDARAADQHLRQQLAAAAGELDGRRPTAALLCSCNGRGELLFGPIDHDPSALADAFGEIPVAGLFCAGEIGPVGGRNFLHGFTATIALFTTNEGSA